MYDFPSCTQIDAGASCEIRCKHPYRGSSAVATCPANNTDPLKAARQVELIVWSLADISGNLPATSVLTL